MGDFEDAKEWLVEKMGMWWPDADEGKLREAARHWREFAKVVGDVTQETNSKSGTLIMTNSGEAIDTFEIFWGRYYRAGNGWLADLEKAALALAKFLDRYADEVDQAKKDIDNRLTIDATAIVLSIALVIPTGGASSAGAGGVTAAMLRFAASRGAALSVATAELVETTLTTAVLAGLEGITINLAVAQPLEIEAGLRGGLSLADARKAGIWSAALGAGFGGVSTGIRNLKNGEIPPVGEHLYSPAVGPSPSLAGGAPLGPGGIASPLGKYWLSAWKDIPKDVRAKIKKNWDRGNEFNRANHHRYPHNEVHLSNGKQLDSYRPGEEIVSRKHTQLSDILSSTAKGYIDEIPSKYGPDTVIRSDKYPDLDGQPLTGSMILEIPVQKGPIPPDIIAHARAKDVVIRDVNGHVYK
ncbi:WXG100-like domain-containing protein [Streptomyces sp. 3N207]|uniref:WXG100-like domain-containing protein n=1 Tax=Streptomyces sp. 3N207 TaxID=3457417 RepID=UPI003FD2D6B1